MTEHYADQGVLLIRNSDIKENGFYLSDNPIYLTSEFAEQNKTRKHALGDVITVHTGDVGTSAVIGPEEDGSIGFATIVTRPNEKIKGNFLCLFLNTDKHKMWAKSVSTGDGRCNYNLKDYTKLELKVPQIKEQEKVSQIFLLLSELITLHQRTPYSLDNKDSLYK